MNFNLFTTQSLTATELMQDDKEKTIYTKNKNKTNNNFNRS